MAVINGVREKIEKGEYPFHCMEESLFPIDTIVWMSKLCSIYFVLHVTIFE